MFESITPLLSDPAAWAALVTLIVMEVVLGIDNLIFISILSNKLPEHQRSRVRRIGISLALIMRLALLSMIAWIVGLTAPVFTVMGNDFSWKDIILIAGGLFLVWKATKEIHHTVDPTPSHDVLDKKDVVISNAGAAIFQIILLDLVFSIDSVITAVGMTSNYWIMATAVILAIGVMLAFAGPIARFVRKHPTMKTLALAFLVLIGVLLVAEGAGQHLPRGYVYFAMAFSLCVELVNMRAGLRRSIRPAEASGEATGSPDNAEV